MGTRAAWLSTKVRGWPTGGGGTPGATRAGRPRPHPPETSRRSNAPPPPHLKGREASGGSPPPGPGGPGQALFSCLLFQSRAPHPKLREFGDRLGGSECTLASHTAGVGAAGVMFTCEVSPPARLFWSRLREGEVKGGSSPLPLPDTGRSWMGKGGEESQGRGGLLKPSREELRIGERLYRGPGVEKREV